MNYQWHYDRLMDRALERTLVGYSERHHILPKCLGGTYSKANLRRLTPEEHYVAHQLLVKLYPGNIKLIWAASNMTGQTAKMPGRKNKLYGWLRRKLGASLKGRVFSEESKALMKQNHHHIKGFLGKHHSDEAKAKMSAASMGKKKSPEHCASMSKGQRQRKWEPQSPEWIAKRMASHAKTIAQRGRAKHFDDPQYRALQAQKTRESWAKRKCPVMSQDQITQVIQSEQLWLNFHL